MLVVPSLAQAPKEMLAEVYVFTIGIRDAGPFNFRPDVFDSQLGTDELKTAAEVRDAIAKGALILKQPGVVINMPMLTWPNGHR